MYRTKIYISPIRGVRRRIRFRIDRDFPVPGVLLMGLCPAKQHTCHCRDFHDAVARMQPVSGLAVHPISRNIAESLPNRSRMRVSERFMQTSPISGR